MDSPLWRVVPSSDQLVCLTSLSGGTTWHAVGLTGRLRGSKAETQLSEYGCELYSKLEEETGLGTGENSGEWIGRKNWVLLYNWIVKYPQSISCFVDQCREDEATRKLFIGVQNKSHVIVDCCKTRGVCKRGRYEATLGLAQYEFFNFSTLTVNKPQP